MADTVGNTVTEASNGLGTSEIVYNGNDFSVNVIQGNIEVNTDADVYSIFLTKGVTYLFIMYGADSGFGDLTTLGDPILRLLDSAGNQVAVGKNVDGNFLANLCDKLIFTPNNDGLFYMSAEAYHWHPVGSIDRFGDYLVSNLPEIGTYLLQFGTYMNNVSAAIPKPIIITGTIRNDTLYGGDNNNTIKGLNGNDSISGEGGNDNLFGGAGNDTLIGGIGKDIFAGGAGKDTFIFNDWSESGIISNTRDIITDFIRGQDKIDLSAIDANETIGGDQAFSSPTVGGSFSGKFSNPGNLYRTYARRI